MAEIHGAKGTAAMVLPTSQGQKEVLLAGNKSNGVEKIVIALK